MKYLFLLAPIFLIGAPIKVPTEFYAGCKATEGRPSNAPLISDITFRSICDHIIDQGTEWFDPARVKQGDTIYINLWLIHWFHSEVHPEIEYAYILVSCDVGSWLPDPVLQTLFYDPKLAAWFCRNILFSHHPKFFQIPMGQTDRFFGYSNLPLLQQFIEERSFEKRHLLYMNFQPRKVGDRDKIVTLFENESYCFSRNQTGKHYSGIGIERYYEEVATSQFVLSPLGLETDCVRTWESIALGSIPIVEHSFLDPLFEDLPVLFVSDWSEINEPFLKENLKKINQKRRERAFFPYWEKKIREMQTKVRHNDLSSSELQSTLWSDEDLGNLLAILGEEENPFLLYKGFMTALHPLQIENEAPYLSKIFLRDPFLYPESLEELKYYYFGSLASSAQNDKIKLISEEEFFSSLQFSPIFLDLSYQRSSLLRDFNNFRHSLKKDILEIYNKIFPGVLLFGNGWKDPYVKKVLDQLSKEKEIFIQTKGNFWFFRKD